MNLQQLYYFQAISRLKNYTKAAEQLLVAQSSLSHSIGDLERELGVPLFFKVGRNIDITEYGKQFLIHVDRITAELELANQELKNMLNPNMGKIRIALAYTVSNRFIPNMIKGFYENEDNRAIQFEFSEKQAAKMNCTPFVRQYGILSNKWGVLLCQKEYQTNDIRRNSKNW